MRILVTGGAGFIGSHVVAGALAAGHDVAVLDDLSNGKRENVPAHVPLHVVDLRDRAGVERVFEGFAPDAVSHQAAQASVAVSMRDPALDAGINVLGSIHLLDACAKFGTRRVAFASTGGAIYGEVPEGQRAPETAPAAPQSPYAISKLYVEQLLGVYRRQHGVEETILRYANVYGPRQDAHGEAGVIAIFLGAIAEGRPVRINARERVGDDGCIRDYVFVADVARANLAALEGRLDARVMNIATGEGTSTRELAARLFAVTGRQAPTADAAPRPGDLERSVLDPELSGAAFGPPTPLAEGLALTVASWPGLRSTA